MGKSSSKERVKNTALALGLDIDIVEMPASTRTAEEAAAACGCTVGQIVKSLIFQGNESGRLYLLLVSGDHQVNTDAFAKVSGETLGRADPRKVREITGFAIGGVAPIGHLNDIPTYIDRHLLTCDIVWAAAGAPNAIFSVNPKKLKEVAKALEFDAG